MILKANRGAFDNYNDNARSKDSLHTDTSKSYIQFDKMYLIWYFIYTHDHNRMFVRKYTFLLDIEMPTEFLFWSLQLRRKSQQYDLRYCKFNLIQHTTKM